MKVDGRPSTFQIFLRLPSIVRQNRTLLHTPVAVAVTLLFSGLGYGYYYIYRAQKTNESTPLYKQSIEHLANYTPAHQYIGTPYRVRWLKEVKYDKDTVTMVVPISGPKAKARLIIFGKRGESNQVILDHLDIEFTAKDKRWTFFRQVPQLTESSDSKPLTLLSEKTNNSHLAASHSLQQPIEPQAPVIDVKLTQKS